MTSVLPGLGLSIMPTSATSEWMVQVPLSQLVALQNMAHELEELRQENVQLRRRMDGLHRTQYDTMEVIGQLRKAVGVSADRGR